MHKCEMDESKKIMNEKETKRHVIFFRCSSTFSWILFSTHIGTKQTLQHPAESLLRRAAASSSESGRRSSPTNIGWTSPSLERATSDLDSWQWSIIANAVGIDSRFRTVCRSARSVERELSCELVDIWSAMWRTFRASLWMVVVGCNKHQFFSLIEPRRLMPIWKRSDDFWLS